MLLDAERHILMPPHAAMTLSEMPDAFRYYAAERFADCYRHIALDAAASTPFTSLADVYAEYFRLLRCRRHAAADEPLITLLPHTFTDADDASRQEFHYAIEPPRHAATLPLPLMLRH